jgi:hypothetical protein
MSERRPVDRPPSPDTLVVDLDEIEEFDLDSNVVPAEPARLAQGSETHDRSSVSRALSKQQLDAILIAYLLDKDER